MLPQKFALGHATRPPALYSVLFMQITMTVGLIYIVNKKPPFIHLSQMLTASILEIVSTFISLTLRQKSLN